MECPRVSFPASRAAAFLVFFAGPARARLVAADFLHAPGFDFRVHLAVDLEPVSVLAAEVRYFAVDARRAVLGEVGREFDHAGLVVFTAPAGGENFKLGPLDFFGIGFGPRAVEIIVRVLDLGVFDVVEIAALERVKALPHQRFRRGRGDGAGDDRATAFVYVGAGAAGAVCHGSFGPLLLSPAGFPQPQTSGTVQAS